MGDPVVLLRHKEENPMREPQTPKKEQQIFLQSKGDLNLTKERIKNDVRY